MQQLLSCLTLPGRPCCEYPYTLTGADCVRQCLEAFFGSLLNKRDTDLYVGMNFGIRTAECTASSKITDIIMLIDLLVYLFEDAEARVANGLTPLTMEEVWEQNDLRCIAASLSRKYGFNMAVVFPLAGITDPLVAGLYPAASIPVPGSYSCGTPGMPDPDGPEPPAPSCFIEPDAFTENIVCEETLQDMVLVSGTVSSPELSGLFTPGTPPVGDEALTYYWLNGFPIYNQSEPVPGEFIWEMTFGDGYSTSPETGVNPWDASWHDTFGAGTEIPTVVQATLANLCGSTIINVQLGGSAGANGDYFSGPTFPGAEPGTVTYYMGEYVIMALIDTVTYTWYIAKTGPLQLLYKSTTTGPDPWGLLYESVLGVDPAPELLWVPLFDFSNIVAPVEGVIYSILCCELPLFATFNAGTGTYETYLFPPNYVLQAGGILYTDIGNGPGMLFPSVTLTLLGPSPNTYTLSSNSPQTANGRIVRVEGFRSGVWVEIWQGDEDILPQDILIVGGIPTLVRAIYRIGDCEYVSASTLTIPPPGSCGTIIVSITPSPDCAGGSGFFVTVDIQDLLGFQLGFIIPTVDAVVQSPVPAVLGQTVLGPYPIDAVVSVRVTNLIDVACDYISADLTSPQLPASDFDVYSVVDANFQASALPTELYLIGSDVDNIGNLWASHVGETSLNNVFGTIPDGDIVRAEVPPGLDGYWEMVLGLPVQLYPPVTMQFNTVTEVWVALENPVAPSTIGTNIVVSFECPVFGTGFVYSGLLEDFVDTPFAPNCVIPNVSGRITYFVEECPFTVPAIITQFTPTGDPDPDFITGLNNNVFDLQIESGTQNIVVVGQFTEWQTGGPPIPTPYMTRLRSNGDLDTTYNANLGSGFELTAFPLQTSVDAVSIDSSNRAVVAGNFNTVDVFSANYLARINTTGIPDAAFLANMGAGFDGRVRDIAIQSDGKIICVGDFSNFDGEPCGKIARLLPSGLRDPSFVSGIGTGFNNLALIVLIDPTDGTIIVGKGFFSSYNDGVVHSTGGIVRLDPNTGSFLGTITTGLINDAIRGISVQPNGDLIVTGEFTYYGTFPTGSQVNHIMRLSPTGVIDPVFLLNNGRGFEPTAIEPITPPSDPSNSGWTTKSLIMANGQIVVAIYQPTIPVTFNGINTNGLVRLNADGSRDLSFNTGSGFGGRTNVIDENSLGQLVVGGLFTTLNGVPTLRVAILN